jgi:lipopolysaccharide/colanic/teichoic acid biosynthesis glycosyltransferase
MLLDMTSFLVDDSDRRKLGKLVSALSASIREIDIIGWYSNQSTIGVIFTEIPSDARKSIESTLFSRVTGILYKALTFEQFNQISISQHVFPEQWDHDVPQRPSHPALYPDLSKYEDSGSFFSVSKRIMDLIGSALGLLFSFPLFLLIALVIKLSSKGPVLFRQVRVGQYGTPFVFLKFRSMYVDNDPALHREYVRALISGRAEFKPSADGRHGVYKLTGDPRVTRIGALLRKTSLDELPQLYNVLKGEMSLVGPRPAIPYEVQAYDLWHRRRVLEAKPGITGLWQVKGRSRVTFDEMVRLDVRYAMTRSLWLDIKILMDTPRAVILGQGAW